MSTPNLFIVYVSDVASASAFYSKLFEMEPRFSSPRFVEFPVAEGVGLALWSGAPSARAGDPTGEVCLNLPGGPDRIEREFRRWRELGVTVVAEPHDDVFGRTFVACDPDGNLLRVAPVDPVDDDTAGDVEVIRLGQNGSRIEVLARGSQTDGLVSVLRWRMSPTSTGPGAHFHETFAETFLVEAGHLDVLVGDRWRTLGPGDLAHAERGQVHALRKPNDAAASVVMILTPGVPREDYFATLAAGNVEDEELLHARFDNHFV